MYYSQNTRKKNKKSGGDENIVALRALSKIEKADQRHQDRKQEAADSESNCQGFVEIGPKNTRRSEQAEHRENRQRNQKNRDN